MTETAGRPLLRVVRLLQVAELLLLVFWIIVFALLRTYESPDIYYARLAILLSLLGHLGTALALITLNHGLLKGHPGWERWFWLFGTLFTDIWSALDAWLDLWTRDISAAALALVRAFTTTALVISGLAVIVYFAALFLGGTNSNEKAAHQLAEALLPQPLLRPAKVKPIHKY